MISVNIGKKRIKAIRERWRFYNFSRQNRDIAACINKVKAQNLTYLSTEALIDLAEAAIKIEASGLSGIVLEAGCALGGSAVVLAKSKQAKRKCFVYDVFEMIPPPSDKDGSDVQERYRTIKSGSARGIGSNLYYGYETNLYDKVVENLRNFDIDMSSHNIRLVKGLYQDTLWLDEPVVLAHIDCDWYDSVLTCLSRIEPHLIKGGTLVIDDYYHWSGCRHAVDDYFRNKDGYEFTKKSRLHITKM